MVKGLQEEGAEGAGGRMGTEALHVGDAGAQACRGARSTSRGLRGPGLARSLLHTRGAHCHPGQSGPIAASCTAHELRMVSILYVTKEIIKRIITFCSM